MILIAGKKRSGKDHFAKILKEELENIGKTAHITRFADPAKDILCKSFGISRDELDRLKDNAGVVQAGESAVSMRRFLQTFSTEAMQGAFGKDIWVNLTVQKIKGIDADYVIIPDFRFLHEILDRTTLTILVEREDSDQTHDAHISENELCAYPFDEYIRNSFGKDLIPDARRIASMLT